MSFIVIFGTLSFSGDCAVYATRKRQNMDKTGNPLGDGALLDPEMRGFHTYNLWEELTDRTQPTFWGLEVWAVVLLFYTQLWPPAVCTASDRRCTASLMRN